MSCIYIDECPSATGWCNAQNTPDKRCVPFLLTAYYNLRANKQDQGSKFERIISDLNNGIKPTINLNDKEGLVEH